jgi:hypothetical protein
MDGGQRKAHSLGIERSDQCVASGGVASSARRMVSAISS